MTYFEKIDDHIKNKFDSMDKIQKIKRIENIDKNMGDNILYELPLISIAVDVVKFKELNKKIKPKIMAAIMSEFTYGVTKIMRGFSGDFIDIQGDGIYCILNGSEKKDVKNAFSLACALHSFKHHIKKIINKKFPKIFENHSSFAFLNLEFDFGIGLWLSSENYISKVGFWKTRDLIFMGESVNNANALAKLASRKHILKVDFLKPRNMIFNNKSIINHNILAKLASRSYRKSILMNNAFKINLNINFNGFYSFRFNEFKELIWECDWSIRDYDNFIKK